MSEEIKVLIFVQGGWSPGSTPWHFMTLTVDIFSRFAMKYDLLFSWGRKEGSEL